MCFDVCIVDGEGEPVEGATVTAQFPVPGEADQVAAVTDEKGQASFQLGDEHEQIHLCVQDLRFGPFNLHDGSQIVLTL